MQASWWWLFCVGFACSPDGFSCPVGDMIIGVIVSMNGRLSLCVNPVIDWQHVQDVSCLSPNYIWHWLQHKVLKKRAPSPVLNIEKAQLWGCFTASGTGWFKCLHDRMKSEAYQGRSWTETYYPMTENSVSVAGHGSSTRIIHLTALSSEEELFWAR